MDSQATGMIRGKLGEGHQCCPIFPINASRFILAELWNSSDCLRFSSVRLWPLLELCSWIPKLWCLCSMHGADLIHPYFSPDTCGETAVSSIYKQMWLPNQMIFFCLLIFVQIKKKLSNKSNVCSWALYCKIILLQMPTFFLSLLCPFLLFQVKVWEIHQRNASTIQLSTFTYRIRRAICCFSCILSYLP